MGWGGHEGRMQQLAEVLSAPEAHLPAVIALRDALAAGQHCCHHVVCRACIRQSHSSVSNCNQCCVRQGNGLLCTSLALPRTQAAANLT